MKQKRGMSWLWIGISAIVFIWLGLKTIGYIAHLGHVDMPRGFGRGHQFGQGGWGYHFKSHHGLGLMGMSAIAMVLIKVVLLGVFAVVWAKATGLLKWGGAVLTGLSLMSLLTPFWGLVVMLLLFLAQGRMKRINDNYGNQPFIGEYPVSRMNVPVTSSYERGRLLDEWEKRNYKEEKQ
ncbi:hypothetical protein [Paenibacillus sp. GCM10028914]|uniref:hypothetical protein n=1 Tax=Paenibacillus sp. GCM10028914 TaxID=3273416 RepID=UPI003616307E